MTNIILNKYKIFYTLTRAYSLPISVMSWFIPFLYASFNGGNILFGIIALIGIILLHLASNLFDDIIDYLKELSDIKKGKKQTFNFQKGKCKCILDNDITIKQAIMTDFLLFLFSALIGIFFICTIGAKLLYVIFPTAILCLVYPILGSLGFGEIIIGTIFSPLLYSGVYFVMTKSFSYEILILAVSTGLLTVSVLLNHSVLDYKYDTTNRKITLCSICKTEKIALTVLTVTILCAYLNLLFWILTGYLHLIYLLPMVTIVAAFKLIKEMNIYINEGKVSENSKVFLEKFLLAQNLQKYFIMVLGISIILYYWFKL